MTRGRAADTRGRGLERPLVPFVDPLPIPPRRVITEPTRLTIPLRTSRHRFHQDLPPSPVWAYDGVVPGPTIEVRRGVPLEIRWENRIEGFLPVVVTTASRSEVDGVPVQSIVGRSDDEPDRDAARLPGFSVAHLHGGMTGPNSDGWAENLARPGQHELDSYPNDQRAQLLWYHDHVMGVTRFSVYAGLAGLYIVRDDMERDLGLPAGPPCEIPLLLQDRNFDSRSDGRLTGSLLHRTDPEVMECFGPVTVVNGAVWPHLDVEPGVYRFRILNGSNARTFRLVLMRDGRPDHDRIVQTGADGGLFGRSVALPEQGLVLAPAERADVLVDLSDLAPGTELTWLNSARAPFDGTFADPAGAATPDPEGLLPYPEVMQLRVVEPTSAAVSGPRPLPVGAPLVRDIQRIDRSALTDATVRAIALVEQEIDPGPPMLTMRELQVVDEAGPDLLTLVDPGRDGHSATTRHYRVVASRFGDAATFFPVIGRPEIWRLVNLTGDTHPIHVHADAFQVLDRLPATVDVPGESITPTMNPGTVRIGRAPDDRIPHALDDNELWLKDTVRVNANEVVDIAVRFDVYAGRYMYHCHILEHEDRDMMRPFVVMPAELMSFMAPPAEPGRP